jgi:GNAT superfamily N-acetyltransferase
VDQGGGHERPDGPQEIRLEWFVGDREELRSLFSEAEDSSVQLAAYINVGQVLVARESGLIVGHLQLVPTGESTEVELKSMAVDRARRGSGIGRLLVEAAIRHAVDVGLSRMVVSTATADVGNLRFYQRCGFRMLAVERDAFGPESGYPDPICIDGIPLRDRVWFSRDLNR